MQTTQGGPAGHGAPLKLAAHGAQSGWVIWLTGLSASGKTTIAVELERALEEAGRRIARIDGDELRRGLCADLGYSAADRSENVRRAAAWAAASADAGFIAIVALISPFRADREAARRAVIPSRFIEVYVATPIEVCRRRDPKGLYARADRGEIAEFTGISSPYEPPDFPEIVLETDQTAPIENVARIVDYLRSRECCS